MGRYVFGLFLTIAIVIQLDSLSSLDNDRHYDDFDWIGYQDSNPDLCEAGICSKRQSWMHWLRSGRREGRSASHLQDVDHHRIAQWTNTMNTTLDQQRMSCFKPNYSYLDGAFDIFPSSAYSFMRRDHSPVGRSLQETPFIENPRTADLSRWYRLLLSLNASMTEEHVVSTSKPTLTILMIGGSFTAGRMESAAFHDVSRCGACESGKAPNPHTNCKACAYPLRFQHWLELFYDNKVDVNVINYGVGGSRPSSILGTVAADIATGSFGQLDAVFINYCDNDIAHDRNLDRWRSKVAGYMELLLRLLLSHPAAPVVIEIQQRVRSDPPYLWSPHSDVCEYYGVPVLSYDRASLDLMGRHPNCLGHQTMADWLAYQWLQATKHSCTYRIEHDAPRREVLPVARYSGKKYEATHTSSDAELVDFCQYPLTSILPRVVAAPPASSLNLSHPRKRYHSTSNWVEGEDEALNSKPGFWVDDSRGLGGSIVFEVQIDRRQPLITVGYLQSYDHSMGKVRITAVDRVIDDDAALEAFNGVSSDATNYLTIDGYDEINHNSQTKHRVICIPSSPVDPAAATAVMGSDSIIPNCTWSNGMQHYGSEYYSISTHNTTPDIKNISLIFNLVPRRDTERNKFVLRYIFTC